MPRGELEPRWDAPAQDLRARARAPRRAAGVPAVGLHRVDICNRTGAFGVLADETRRRAFDAHLLKLLEASHYLAFGVTIDKAAHASAKHRRVSDSYHYCMLATLERFCGRLAYRNNVGDVMVEQRGKKEDQALKAEFRRLVERREGFLRDSASRLTSNEIKLKPKSADVPGLQLADLVAATTRAGVEHHEHRVEARMRLAHRLDHGVGDIGVRVRPGVDDFVVAFAVGD